jgi:hypothetical protein
VEREKYRERNRSSMPAIDRTSEIGATKRVSPGIVPTTAFPLGRITSGVNHRTREIREASEREKCLARWGWRKMPRVGSEIAGDDVRDADEEVKEDENFQQRKECRLPGSCTPVTMR